MIRAISLVLMLLFFSFPQLVKAEAEKDCVDTLTKITASCRQDIKGDDLDIQFSMCLYKRLMGKSEFCDKFYKEQCSENGDLKIKCKSTTEMTIKKASTSSSSKGKGTR